jgi:ribosomal protein S18 acetylase RimI-like enzyme
MSEMPVRIEPISPEDVEDFCAALDSVARERLYLAAFEAPPIEQVRAFVETNLREGNPHVVARGEDRLVGWCDITRHRSPLRAHCGVLGMGVVAGHRGAGIGRALLSAALSAARAAGMLRVELEVRGSNTPAIALYERMGFRHEGRKIAACRIDGTTDDMLIMGLVWPEPGPARVAG